MNGNNNTFGGAFANGMGAISGVFQMAQLATNLGCNVVRNADTLNDIGGVHLTTSLAKAQMNQKVEHVHNVMDYTSAIAEAKAKVTKLNENGLDIDMAAIFQDL